MDREAQTELARLLGRTLIERRDVFAVQQQDGSYRPKIEPGTKAEDKAYVPIRLSDLVDHLDERATYGHYLVSAENLCRCFCFDIDLRKAPTTEQVAAGLDRSIVVNGEIINPRAIWRAGDSPMKQELAIQLRTLAGDLAYRCHDYRVKTLVAYSGNKGMHVYGVLPEHTPAAEGRGMATMILGSFSGEPFAPWRGNNFFRSVDHTDETGEIWQAYPALEIEVFPKQDQVNGDHGVGNLLRLPLGLNRKSGKRGFFIDLTLGDKKLGKDDPMVALTEGSVR